MCHDVDDYFSNDDVLIINSINGGIKQKSSTNLHGFDDDPNDCVRNLHFDHNNHHCLRQFQSFDYYHRNDDEIPRFFYDVYNSPHHEHPNVLDQNYP